MQVNIKGVSQLVSLQIWRPTEIDSKLHFLNFEKSEY